MTFPFEAIVGQEPLKTALILNVIDPGIGGLLVMGEKGTAKSTAIRSLAELLPRLEAIDWCPCRCAPTGPRCTCSSCAEPEPSIKSVPMRVVELPLGITEDRLVGSIDIEHALKAGEKRFERGLLAEAHRNFLYVDEVNLLEDHIVDLLLDSAAMGVNTVEREGISISHPARFILVGSMNPEEGDLRPQLLDRFGLAVRVSALTDKAARMEVLKRRMAYDADPAGFSLAWRQAQEAMAERIVSAQRRLADVRVEDGVLERIVSITAALELDGHRADIVMVKAARALAAYRGVGEVGPDEISEAARHALVHRQRRLPFEDAGDGRARLSKILEEVSP
ncbi:MAG: magnesium chelatase ATPase subunit I [Phyllobacteriaceae bacterium]|nr:magnesium chelatase ATPase subunit I [Phyllobacteriaceae bacterium]